MPRPRFTLRSLIITVAIVGVTFGAWQFVRRCRRLADEYAGTASFLAGLEEGATRNSLMTHEEWQVACRDVEQRNRDSANRGGRVLFYGTPQHPSTARREAKRSARLRANYERAARYPWLPLQLDSPQAKNVGY